MAKCWGLEGVGKESGKKEDPGQDRKINGQAHQDKDIFICLMVIENLDPLEDAKPPSFILAVKGRPQGQP